MSVRVPASAKAPARSRRSFVKACRASGAKRATRSERAGGAASENACWGVRGAKAPRSINVTHCSERAYSYLILAVRLVLQRSARPVDVFLVLLEEDSRDRTSPRTFFSGRPGRNADAVAGRPLRRICSAAGSPAARAAGSRWAAAAGRAGRPWWAWRISTAQCADLEGCPAGSVSTRDAVRRGLAWRAVQLLPRHGRQRERRQRHEEDRAQDDADGCRREQGVLRRQAHGQLCLVP